MKATFYASSMARAILVRCVGCSQWETGYAHVGSWSDGRDREWKCGKCRLMINNFLSKLQGELV